MMIKIRIYSVGKTKEEWLEMAVAEYVKRIQKTAFIEWILTKSDDQLAALVQKEASVVCLDASGQMMDSPQFSLFLAKQLESGGARLAFVIGGAEGLPACLKRAYPLLSFSRMTFTHQMVRLILVEQIYRALEIAKGSKYHKS